MHDCQVNIRALVPRQTESHLNMRLCYFCIKGVAGIMVNTDVYVPHLSEFYLTNKRDVRSNYIK